jgi:hypothetical protein
MITWLDKLQTCLSKCHWKIEKEKIKKEVCIENGHRVVPCPYIVESIMVMTIVFIMNNGEVPPSPRINC